MLLSHVPTHSKAAMSNQFNSTSKFRVSLVHSDGSSERVSVQIGLDGLKISDANTSRVLRSYELNHISRWQSRGNSLVLYTRTPVDIEERQLTLDGDEHTIRSALDVLTCSCMQLAEILQSKQSNDAQETANSLHALVAGDGKKKTKLPSADDVEYWKSPAMEGWLQCQGEHLKSWRKRWFVLKQGYLFRFMDATVNSSSKPRGVVDLSKIQDVSQAAKITGRQFSFQLKTSTGGSVCYLCENETDLVMWMSAVNREVEKIVKALAGVEDEPPPKPKPSSTSNNTAATEWMKQLEKSFDQLGTSDTGSGSRGVDRDRYGSSGGPAMVNVIGYETIGGGSRGGGGGSGHGRQGGSSSSSYLDTSDHYGSRAYGNGGGSGIDYSQVAGASVMDGSQTGVSADTLLNYGGGGAGHLGGSSDRSGGYSTSKPSQSNYQQPASSGYTIDSGYSTVYASNGYASTATAGNGYGNGSAHGGYAAVSHGEYSLQPQPQQQQQHGAYSQQQQQQASLIDQVPHSQPSYPYYQQGMPQAAPTPTGQSQWQVHHTAEGRPYYYNITTGTTTWDAPPGM